MSNPLISVVIPVYNTAPYLEKCLDSVVKQTYQNLQVIIINDGSTDNSAEICQKFTNKDNRIEFINKQNEGVSIARNIGIEKSKGEWIYFLDSDDFIDLNMFEYLIETAFKKECDIIQFGIRSFKNKQLVSERLPSNNKEYTDLKKFIEENQLKPISACLHFINTSIIKNNSLCFNENLKHGEDMLFMYSTYSYARKIFVLDKVFYNQVLSPNSASRKPIKAKVIFDKLLFLSEICKFAKKNHKINELKTEINNLSKELFVLPLQMQNYSEFKNHKSEFQKIYRKLYNENKDIFEKSFLKVGYLDLEIVISALRVNHYLRKIDYNK